MFLNWIGYNYIFENSSPKIAKPLPPYRLKQPESGRGQVGWVYGGHLKRCEKILAYRSPGGRVRRSATRTEPEER